MYDYYVTATEGVGLARLRRNGIVWVIVIAVVLVGLVVSRSSLVDGEDGQGQTLTVSAAANVQPAFEEIGMRFTEATGIRIVFNFGSTGQLTQQIEAGAPVDVFASADVGFVDELEASNSIIPSTRAIYARGRLALWTRAGEDLTMTDLQDLTGDDIERIAIANPDHAPYGRAAREALQATGIWDEIQPKIVFGESVRDAQQFAATGNVDVALIPYALAVHGEGDWILVPEDLHEPLDQALAVIRGTAHEDEARDFVQFVTGPEGRAVLASFGYTFPESE